MSDTVGLRPDIQEWEFGIRELTRVKVYPLSMSDQLDFIPKAYRGFQDVVQKGDKFTDDSEETNMLVMNEIITFIQQEIEALSLLVLDNKVDFTKCTNAQIVNLATIIYDVNYGDSLKNAKSLMEKVIRLFRK